MKKTGLLAGVLTCALAATTLTGTVFASAETAGEENKNYFQAPGFDTMIREGETEYNYATGNRARFGRINGSVKAKKEADGNIYVELGKEGNNAFCFSFVTLEEAGDYNISFDIKHAEGWTGNSAFFGCRFWTASINDQDIPWGVMTTEMNAATTTEWTTVTTTVNVTAAALTGTDSIHIGYDADAEGNNFLMIDNIVIEYVVPDDGAPAIVGDATKSWKEEEAADVTFGVDLKGYDLQSVTDKATEEEFTEGYTYSATDKTIKFESDFVKDLGEGSHTLVLTTEKGTLELVLTVYYKTAQIPSTTDGYELKATMKGGDFEGYEVGLKFSDAQTEEAWGSLASYDDVGTIVDDNGNHALRLGRADGSTKMYSSAFCMTSPDIALGDIVTLKYSYKVIGDVSATAGKTITSAFIGASNTPYHQIKFLEKPAKTTEGNANVSSWDVKYSEGENGYTNVETSFIVDFAFLNSTNSLRFLFELVEGVEIYIDNVELIRWVEEGAEDAEVPVATGANLAFDNNSPADVTLTVDLKDYNISSIANGSATVARANYTLSENDTKLTISKDYLATLENGKHTFTLTTLGGTCTFEITVSNKAAEEPAKGGCGTIGFAAGGMGGGIALGIVALSATLAMALRKKKSAE